jgi:hypothetical protein
MPRIFAPRIRGGWSTIDVLKVTRICGMLADD